MKTTKALNLIYFLIVGLFLLDILEKFDIKNQALKSFVYLGIMISTPLVLAVNFFNLKELYLRIAGVAIPIIILAGILIIGPLKIMFATGAWRTQTILYKSISSNSTIEFQMQDKGAFGYNRRTVKVSTLTPLFIIINKIPNHIEENTDWKKVDTEVNELGLK